MIRNHQVDPRICALHGVYRIQRNPVFHLLAGVVIFVTSVISIGILVGPLLVGYFRALRKEEEGGDPDLSDIFSGVQCFLPALIATLLSGLVIFIFMCIFILPAFIPMAILPAALYRVFDGEENGLAAFLDGMDAFFCNAIMAPLVTGAYFAVMLVVQILASFVPLGWLLVLVFWVVGIPIFWGGFYKMADQMVGRGRSADYVFQG